MNELADPLAAPPDDRVAPAVDGGAAPSLHDIVQAELRRREMSQNAFAEAIGMDKGGVSRILRGADKASPRFIRETARVFGLDPHVLADVTGLFED